MKIRHERNYDFHWNEGGSSNITCSEVYHGGAPFNQPESRNVRDFMLTIADRTPIYLALHSYGQYFLTPWGYTSDLPEDYAQLEELAMRAIEKLTAVSGTKYKFGTSTNMLCAYFMRITITATVLRLTLHPLNSSCFRMQRRLG